MYDGCFIIWWSRGYTLKIALCCNRAVVGIFKQKAVNVKGRKHLCNYVKVGYSISMTSSAWHFFKALDANRLLSALRRRFTVTETPNSPAQRSLWWLDGLNLNLRGYQPTQVLAKRLQKRRFARQGKKPVCHDPLKQDRVLITQNGVRVIKYDSYEGKLIRGEIRTDFKQLEAIQKAENALSTKKLKRSINLFFAFLSTLFQVVTYNAKLDFLTHTAISPPLERHPQVQTTAPTV